MTTGDFQTKIIDAPEIATAEEVAAAPMAIPGYTLGARLGAGGYGEVWEATAPGGMKKAVKIVFGGASDERADREMKAVERVRAMRHPYLLTMERVEVIEGRLVIITELADGSLLDLFNEQRRAGQPGIDREELMRYLTEAAEALDYMNDEQSLLHLDIKPENLLIVGEHVKVADFGLTKDLQQTAISSPSGMTPMYSAPEVFEGHPARQSDQYSLAVVYQHMLTGELPFNGRSVAQVAVQHLRGTPDLSTLPIADRAVLSRALAKKPERRFETCKELMEKLGRRSGKPSASRPTKSARRAARSVAVEQLLAKYPKGTSRTAYDLPPLEPSSGPAGKTLFVGLGGIGCRVVAQLKASLAESPHRVLAIDADPADLNAIANSENTPLSRDEMVELPLKRSDEYRKESDKYLDWLERRWLFNIPRSRTPEGVRGLGRLAMVAYEERIAGAVSSALQEMWGSSSDDRIHVVLTASPAGGAGSGMLFDMAQLVRRAEKKLGESQAGFAIGSLTAILLDIRDLRSQSSVATANTVACIDELFQHAGREDQTAILDDVYCTTIEAARISDVSDYLRISAGQTLAGTLQKHRETTRARREFREGYIRSFGVGRSQMTAPDDESIDRLVANVLDRWHRPAEVASDQAEGFLRDTLFDAHRFSAEVESFAGGSQTTAAEPIVAKYLDRLWQSQDEPDAQRILAAVFQPDAPGGQILAALESHLESEAEKSAVVIAERLAHLEQPSPGFLPRWAGVLRSLPQALKDRHEQVSRYQRAAVDGAESHRIESSDSFPPTLVKLAMFRLVQEAMIRFAKPLARAIETVASARQQAIATESGVTAIREQLATFEDTARVDIATCDLVERKIADVFANDAETEPVEPMRRHAEEALRVVQRNDSLAEEVFTAASPALCELGGTRRTFVVAPAELHAGLAGNGRLLTRMTDDTESPTVCIEANDIPIGVLIEHVVAGNPKSLELLPHVRSRRDIDW